ncbi:MAG: hypothetical protein GXX96_36050 [Planctomycetaceae bacterium]|nr:hypothetical protein [Planctomycetaceae bacterium]
MDFHTYTSSRDTAKKAGRVEDPDAFYRAAFNDARRRQDGMFTSQLVVEQAWEHARRPYYNVSPSIIPMLTRLNLDLDSTLIRLPLPAICVRLPCQQNPLAFDWQGQPTQIRSVLMGEAREGQSIVLLIDQGDTKRVGTVDVPVGMYISFLRQPGQTVEQSLASLPRFPNTNGYIDMPESLLADCVRLCCCLCLLENDPAIISPDVLSKDQEKFDETGDQKFVEKAHRRGKVGWNVGRHIEVVPHYRRPHMALVWTGHGRAVPKIVPRRGSVVHRELVEKVPSGFGG